MGLMEEFSSIKSNEDLKRVISRMKKTAYEELDKDFNYLDVFYALIHKIDLNELNVDFNEKMSYEKVFMILCQYVIDKNSEELETLKSSLKKKRERMKVLDDIIILIQNRNRYEETKTNLVKIDSELANKDESLSTINNRIEAEKFNVEILSEEKRELAKSIIDKLLNYNRISKVNNDITEHQETLALLYKRYEIIQGLCDTLKKEKKSLLDTFLKDAGVTLEEYEVILSKYHAGNYNFKDVFVERYVLASNASEQERLYEDISAETKELVARTSSIGNIRVLRKS